MGKNAVEDFVKEGFLSEALGEMKITWR